MNFKDKDWDILKNCYHNKKILYSFGKFYTKEVSLKKALNEIVAKKICHKMNLSCPNYQLVMVDNKYYILSEDLNQENIFFTAREIGIDEKINSSLPRIWQILQNTR